jgi:adenosylcobinamide kinase/adenosylcobinamide-phosphate guanylyltransferase
MERKLIFLLGGARSGKSRHAQEWAEQNGRCVLFVATAQAFDDDMQARIARHQAERPATWTTLEAPLNAGGAIAAAMAAVPQAVAHDVVVVDCLTLLASNALLTLPEGCTQDEANAIVMGEVEELLAACERSAPAVWLVVSNEVGMGIVPPSKLGRLYRDALGRANQRLAQAADEVLLLVAGLPWRLK